MARKQLACACQPHPFLASRKANLTSSLKGLPHRAGQLALQRHQPQPVRQELIIQHLTKQSQA
jgi:hypothetical protein